MTIMGMSKDKINKIIKTPKNHADKNGEPPKTRNRVELRKQNVRRIKKFKVTNKNTKANGFAADSMVTTKTEDNPENNTIHSNVRMTSNSKNSTTARKNAREKKQQENGGVTGKGDQHLQ